MGVSIKKVLMQGRSEDGSHLSHKSAVFSPHMDEVAPACT